MRRRRPLPASPRRPVPLVHPFPVAHRRGLVASLLLAAAAALAARAAAQPAAGLAAPAAPPANTCSDPYWSTSLRCKVFPNQVPQPAPAPPATPSAVRQFTRLELTDPAVRCLDGTRPVIYVDPAAGGPSDKWLFTFAGGGACAARDGDGDGSFEDAQGCVERYVTSERGEMGTASEPAMKNIGTSPQGSEGIHSPDLARNPVFARYNRVRIEKCGYDNHQGSATHEGARASAGGTSVSFTLYQHGRRIAELALDTLRRGKTYTSWRVKNGKVRSFSERLPALVQAEQVLLVGHSRGAHGLLYNLDALAERMQGWQGFAADVRGVLDSNFLPSLENEAAFTAPPAGDAYDRVWAGSSSLAGDYDAESYYQDSGFAAAHASWLPAADGPLEALLDRSCLESHRPRGEEWICHDRYHVLFHHTATPFFLREDRSDANIEHTNAGRGHYLTWGELGSYGHCPAVGVDPCSPLLPVGDPSPYRDRQERQALTLAAGLATRSELATGEDTSGPPPSLAIWLPDCGAHEGVYDDRQFFTTRLARDAGVGVTLRQQLEAFVAAPRTGEVVVRIHGRDGYATRCAR